MPRMIIAWSDASVRRSADPGGSPDSITENDHRIQNSFMIITRLIPACKLLLMFCSVESDQPVRKYSKSGNSEECDPHRRTEDSRPSGIGSCEHCQVAERM